MIYKFESEEQKMTTNEKVISDMELDMVVGGASTLLLKKREDGKVDGILVSAEGDLDQLKKMLSGGEVSKIKTSATLKVAQGIHADKIDAYIDRQKKRYPDLEISWAE